MSNANKLSVLAVLGTRPEIIRLAPTLQLLDKHVNLIIAHTGQNYDFELNEIFFNDLGLRKPDYFMSASSQSLASMVSDVLINTERIIQERRPDAMLVLGDTNSGIASFIAKRMEVPIFHMEAGNRSFDENVPEETNRRLIDHISDYNLVYTEHARRNLLAEGIHPSRIALTGSPMREVLESNSEKFSKSTVVSDLGLVRNEYILVSLHRAENVDISHRLETVFESLDYVSSELQIPVVVSTHPRTRDRIASSGLQVSSRVRFHPPFGFVDYIRLQIDAKVVLSDSGTIAEESSILGFPAVTLRDFIERPEALESGAILTAGLSRDAIQNAITFVLSSRENRSASVPDQYQISNTSERVVNFILSSTPQHRRRVGLLDRR